MSKSTNGLRRSGIAVLATTALVAGAGFAGVGAANADETFAFERVAGQTRYDVSAATAKKFESADSVLLASGEEGKFGDALTASYLAGDRQVPVLLTQLDETPKVITDAIDSLGTKNITIVGGPLSVSEAQEAALKAKGYNVDRIFGQTRYDTAAAVIKAAGDRGNDTALIATGEKFPDALSAGPLAYAEAMPIGTVSLTDAPDAVIDALKAAGVTKAVVLGGNLSVGAEPRAELRAKGIEIVEEFQGRTRGAVSQQVAEYGITQGLSNTRVNVASGRAFSEGADALGGGTLSGEQNRPILITDGEDVVGPYVLDYLSDHANTLTGTDNLLFGGLLSIGQAEEDAMEAAARNTTTNQDFTVTPQDAATVTDDDTTAGDKTDQRQYSVTGLDNTKTYTVALFNADRVDVAENGTVTFLKADGTVQNGGQAGTGTVTSDLVVVNGSGSSGQSDTAAPVNGSITFTVDGDGFEDVVPVVYLDGTTANGLDVDANGQPVEAEPFGVGGLLNVMPEEAGTGALINNWDIVEVNKANDYVVAEDTANAGTFRVFNYDANDTYYTTDATDANQKTMAGFEKILTVGDDLIGDDTDPAAIANSTNYRTQPEFSSRFVLDNTNPAAPAIADVEEGATGAVVTVTKASVEPGATVNVYIAPAGDDFADAKLAASSASDQDAKTAEFQVNVSGLQPQTSYEVYVTQTVDGEESEPNTTTAGSDTFTTTATPDTGITVSNVSVADVNNGIGDSNTVIVTFSKEVTCEDAAGVTVSPQGQPGLVFTSTVCTPPATLSDTITYTLDGTLDDASTDITYNVAVAAGAVENTVGQPNQKITGSFAY